MIDTIVFDWKRTLYDPDLGELIAGTKEILAWLKQKGVKMVLIGKGGDDMHGEVKKLGVGDFFSNIVFQEGDKDITLFKPFVNEDSSKNILFIGDRVRSELEAGNKLGATTIWVKQGKFAKEKPLSDDQLPTYTVNSLIEAKALLQDKFFLDSAKL